MIYTLYRYRPLMNQIDDLLSFGKSWNTLSYSDIETLAGHAIKALGKDADLCVTESSDLDLILHLTAKQLLTGMAAEELVSAITGAATAYLHDHLKQLFNERIEERDQEMKIEAGLRPWTNRQTGELEWSRA